MKRIISVIFSIAIIVIITACSNTSLENVQNETPDKGVNNDARKELSDRIQKLTKDWKTNWEKHTISYDDLLAGGPFRDGIPSLENPTFIPISKAENWLEDNEPVMVVSIEGDVRAYPIQILMWHEIVNDVVGGKAVLVSYCPLCNSAIVFDRRLQGVVYEFGVSGLLVNSDLVMYDRTTESLWQQFTGEAIVGDLVGGPSLTMLPSSLISFGDFKQTYPEGVVLSRDTGYDKPYGRNPYVGYDERDSSYFEREQFESVLPAMERVVTISLQAEDKAYPYSILKEMKVIHDTVGSQEVVVFYKTGTASPLDKDVIKRSKDVGASGVFLPFINGKKVTFQANGEEIVDVETNSTWNILGFATAGALKGTQLQPIVHGDHFWFSWIAFKPNTSIYTLN